MYVKTKARIFHFFEVSMSSFSALPDGGSRHFFARV